MTWTTLLIALQRHLFASLRKLLAEQNRDWFVGYEQKMLLDPNDHRVGVVPDLYVLPCQPKDTNFSQWPAYLPDVPVPVFALEVVSGSNWDKDYQGSPQRYAKLGVEELLIFDPLALEGKSPASPPHVLQLYRRGKKGELKRVYAGEGPVWSEEMQAWFRVEGSRVTVTRDREGKSPVLKEEETEQWWEKLEEEREGRREAEEQAAQAHRGKEEAEKAREAAQAKAEQERLAREKAQANAEQERLARQEADKARKAAQDKAEQERLAREAAQAKAEQERLAREEAQAKAEQERLAREEADKARKAAQANAEQERKAKEEAERKAQQERRARERAEQAHLDAQTNAEQERLAKQEAERKATHEALARQQADQARQAAEQAHQQAERARQAAEQEALHDARLALSELCEALALECNEARRQQVDSLDLPALRQLRAFLKQHKRWPD